MDRFASGPARPTIAPERKDTTTESLSTVPPATTSRVSRQESPKKKRSLKKWLLVALATVVVIGGLLWFFIFRGVGAAGQVEGGSYQAVFLTSGQVYFGKLTMVDGSYMKLTDVFYIQTDSTTTVQSTETDSTDMKLIKLGNEIHGPKDSMVISRDQVLFFENLKSDGKVAQTIKDYNDKN